MTPITRSRFRPRYPSSSFAPGLLFLAGEQGAWYDPSDLSTLFQDAAGTVPVTAAGQSVRLMRDKSGRGNHATAPSDAARPVLQADGSGLLHLVFNGTNSSMSTSSVNFTSTDKMTVFCGVRKLSDATTGRVVELSAAADTNIGAFGVSAPSGAAQNFGFNLTGNNGSGVAQSIDVRVLTYTSPITAVVTASFDLSQSTAATELVMRVNGATPGTIDRFGSASAGTGNFGNFAMFIGSRNNASSRFNGRLYGLVVRGSASSAAQIISTERWMAGKTGVTI